jgi:Shedu protein SduA, C-terminal
VQRELGLTGISTNPRALVVIGRASSLTEENRRKLTAMENDRPKLKIMTYDDLLASARATYENTLGPLWDSGPNAEVLYPPKSMLRLKSDAAKQ